MVAALDDIQKKQLPFAMALSLTRTVQAAAAEVRDVMPLVFDRPTGFTLNSLYIKPAKKDEQEAYVRIKDEALKNEGVRAAGRLSKALSWLSPQVIGGPRLSKSSENLLRNAGVLPKGMFVVPGAGARLDRFGNISRGDMQRILSVLKAQRDPQQRTTTRSRKRNRTIRQYFAITTAGHLPLGVYRREGPKVLPVLVFVRQPQYTKRLPFYEVTQEAFRRYWPIAFKNALERALASAR